MRQDPIGAGSGRGFRLDDRLIFPELNIITTKDGSVHVEPKVMQVLVELAKNPGEVLSKAQILESVWAGLFVCDDVVANAISLLRRALGDEAKRPTMIQTIPKRGYRVLATVQPIGSDDVAGSRGLASDLNRCLLRVRHLRQEETESSLRSACAYSEEIIRQEPNCAAVHAELALTLFSLVKLGAVQREDIEIKLRSTVEKAVRLDQRAGLTLVCLAKLECRYDCQWDNAERHFRQALQFSWQDPDVLTECSTMLSAMRQFEESLALAERACVLDPISPAARLQAGHAFHCNSRWGDAAASYRRLLRFSPQHVFARWGLADALTRAGEPHEAIAVITEGLSMAGADAHPLLLTSLLRIQGLVVSSRSNAAAANELKGRTNDPILLAELYGSLGETAQAFKLLNEAVDRKHYRIAAVNMFPQFGAIREDGRYHQLLKRIGL
jgi:DNA-binding winged helix-turn-helix (wHTH) protein/Tfp pilus assembly protein PilF